LQAFLSAMPGASLVGMRAGFRKSPTNRSRCA
jgi:hypothetical protein